MKLNSAQVYAAQVRADRKAAAKERQDTAIKADNIRIQQMMAGRG
jgi:hypothetical protein